MPIIDGKYKNPNWVNGGPPAINAAELNAISDTLENLDAGGGGGGGTSDKTPYIVVGTSANGHTANDCDYLCDGVADQVEINQALEAASDSGKIVLLLGGTYNISGTIVCSNTPLSGVSRDNVTLRRSDSSFNHLIEGNNISHIAIDGNSRSENNDCVEIFVSGASATIQDVSVTGYPGLALSTYVMESQPIYSQLVLDGFQTFFSFSHTSCYIQGITSVNQPSSIQNCVFDSKVQLDRCGSISWAGTIVSNNVFAAGLEMSNCNFCIVSSNIFESGSNLVLSQEGSASIDKCSVNQINCNMFGYSGITLEAGTQRNAVIGNGGWSWETSPEQWLGVTDNGSNNFVANNMPTA